MAVTIEQFRKLALALPDCEEGSHHDHPDFRCGGRVFATIHPGGETGMVKVPPGAQSELVAHDSPFRPATGAWGRAGCTLVDLPQVTQSVLRGAMQEAWQFAAAMGASKRAKK